MPRCICSTEKYDVVVPDTSERSYRLPAGQAREKQAGRAVAIVWALQLASANPLGCIWQAKNSYRSVLLITASGSGFVLFRCVKRNKK